MSIYLSAGHAETALQSLLDARLSVLAESKALAEDVAEKRTPDDAEANAKYKRLQEEFDRLSALVTIGRSDLKDAREDETRSNEFSSALGKMNRGNSMSNVVLSPAKYGRAFAEGQGFADLSEGKAKSIAEAGEYLRAVLTNDVEARATLSEGTGSLGGNLVPLVYASPLLDLARAATVLNRAGAQIVPLAGMDVRVATHNADPVLVARSENGAVAAADTTFGVIEFIPRSYAALVRVSNELIEDSSIDVGRYLAEVFAASAAVTVDAAGLYGSGTAPAVKGIKNVAGVTITHLGAGGAALGNHDAVVDLVARLKTANYSPTALITSPRLEASIAKFREGSGTGAYLEPPLYLRNIPTLVSSSVPVTNVVGASGAVCTDMFAGDFRNVLIGMRHELRISRLVELYAGTGETGFVVDMRFDIQVARPAGIQILDGITN